MAKRKLRSVSYPTIPQLTVLLENKNYTFESLLRVRSGRSAKIVAYIFALLFVAIIVALCTVPWIQTSFGKGRVIAYHPNERQQNIESPIEGRISKWFVSEGTKVKAQDPIAEISDIDPQIMERLQAEKSAAERKLDASLKGLETSKKNMERQLLLSKQGLTSQRGYELAIMEVAKFDSDASSATQELQRIDVRLARQASQTVVAPRDGTIMRIVAAQGTVFVKSGTVLATLVPETNDSAAELSIDGNDLPLMQVGREVRLQFEGWPAIQFSGWPAVAKGTFAGRIGVIDASDDGTGSFRIIVFPLTKESFEENNLGWPSEKILRQGVQVHGWVLLNEVKLGYELWRKFNRFPVALPSSPASKAEAKGDQLKK
jgi:multidrug efflux pump subunit AcrA (membrane-fusion protein)